MCIVISSRDSRGLRALARRVRVLKHALRPSVPFRARLAIAAVLASAAIATSPVMAQDRRDEQFYYPGAFNWTFLRSYPEAARLFNAFDYGHAVLYERLYTWPDSAAAVAALEREYRYLTTDLLVRVLNKNPATTFVVIDEVDTDNWGIAGQTVTALRAAP